MAADHPTRSVYFRLTENEYRLLRSKSNARVLTKYCRSAALGPVPRRDPPAVAFLEKLERVLSILNKRERVAAGRVEHGKD